MLATRFALISMGGPKITCDCKEALQTTTLNKKQVSSVCFFMDMPTCIPLHNERPQHHS